MSIQSIRRLDAALRAAGVPFDGVADNLPIRIDFQASATTADRQAAAAILAAFDSSQAADDTYIAQQAKAQAAAHLDNGALQSGISYERVLRALALVMLDEVNILRATASLAPRTAAQLVNAIKAKISATAE